MKSTLLWLLTASLPLLAQTATPAPKTAAPKPAAAPKTATMAMEKRPTMRSAKTEAAAVALGTPNPASPIPRATSPPTEEGRKLLKKSPKRTSLANSPVGRDWPTEFRSSFQR